jgi:peptidoglycan/xylan/chitin deacetylase (PgdA/CDA1 family)
MLKGLKNCAISAFHGARIPRMLSRTAWRRNRLLILAYHGVSLSDEHLWRPALYMPPEVLESRLEVLQRQNCSVLPLSEALRLLDAGELPERAVSITFDDGFFDFFQHAFPLLSSFGFPATVYLTTYYCGRNRPVFDMACSYLLWKGRARKLAAEWIAGSDRPVFDLRLQPQRVAAFFSLRRFAREAGLTGEEKDELAARLANLLGVDYDAILRTRTLHLMMPEEVQNLATRGIDFELHTHRHRVPMEKAAFAREIDENRRVITAITGREPSHFCYPSGDYAPEFLPWLSELGVASAATCRPGLAARSSHPLLLPRLLDTSSLSQLEFEAWLSGLPSFFPRRCRTGMPRWVD